LSILGWVAYVCGQASANVFGLFQGGAVCGETEEGVEGKEMRKGVSTKASGRTPWTGQKARNTTRQQAQEDGRGGEEE